MTNSKRLALVALAGFGLSASGAITDTEWWNVGFDSPTPLITAGEYGNVTIEGSVLGPLTNDFVNANITQPYASGVWTAVDGDDSYITNGIVTNIVNGVATENTSWHLQLDTQGNDLTWTPTNGINEAIAVVDANLYLVGSESTPEATDFDPNNNVHTAIYLKNYVDDEDSGETTNSVLCVYVRDIQSEETKYYWQELEGVELEDNSWHHIQVLVDYTIPNPEVQVFVDDTQMHARDDATKTSWTVANTGVAATAKKLSSIAFRGTGAVDNFVGQVREQHFEELIFAAEVYMDGVKQAEGSTGNTTRYVQAEAGDEGSGKIVEFPNFLVSDYDYENFERTATWALQSVVFTNFITGSTTTYGFTWNEVNQQAEADSEIPDKIIDIATDEDFGYQTGGFKVTATTDGAISPTNTAVLVYFQTLGAFNAFAETTIGGVTTTNAYFLKPADMPVTTNWTFAAESGENHLASIHVYNDATLTYADGVATVSVEINDGDFDADTLFASAVYAAGALAEGQTLDYTEQDGLFTFTVVDAPVPPVAIIVAGTTTNEYPSLRAAIAAAAAGETVYLVADDRVSFSAEDTEIAIGKALTIDGGSNTLYGVSNYAYDGHNDHDIFISAAAGDVTIKDLKITEFSDTAPTVQQRTYPIWSSQNYAGKLTLDGVQIDKFARGAINLNGGVFEITNCVITGYAGGDGAPASYFQNAITVKNAKGTVAETTVTGIGTHEGSEWGAGLVTFNSNGDGEVTFLSGSYTADYVIEVSSNATGRIVISNGTFIATAPKTDEGEPVSAFQFDEEAADRNLTVTISGGWFDREPEAGYIAEGYEAVADASGPAGTYYKVVEKAVTYAITFTVAGLDQPYFETNVLTGATGYGPATDPTKASTAQFSYNFAGWTNAVAGGAAVATADLPAADGTATWAAVFAEVTNTYDVTFKDYDDSTILVTNVAYGATLYGPADPERSGFTFDGWTNAVAGGAVVAAADLPAVTGEATWTAVYTEAAGDDHIGAKSDEGFVILAPADDDYDTAKPLTFGAPDLTAGTVSISASMIGPDSGTTATLTLLYKTDLNAATYSTAQVEVVDIDATAGTATVVLPNNLGDTVFFFGFSNETGVPDTQP